MVIIFEDAKTPGRAHDDFCATRAVGGDSGRRCQVVSALVHCEFQLYFFAMWCFTVL